MAISTFTELKTALGNWLRPGGTVSTNVTSRIPEFIALFEGEANGSIRLRRNEIETTLTATPNDSFINLPSDYEAPVALWLEEFSPRRRLAFSPPAGLPYWAVATYPSRWTIKDTRIQLDRLAATAYSFTFRYHKTFALSDSAPTNALLTAYPSVYLYGCLLQSAPYVRDAAMLGVWQNGFERAEEMMQEAEDRSKDIVTLGIDAGALQRRPSFNILEG